ncbi:MAG: indolepyruvate ferredoxin oxidoreductase subunit alpha [Clostridiaceae bacterium]|nr:indolepyruvate ferredoxin oxidoreductase subunit alpha [Clostridiaceae bacterium]
MKTLMLGNEAVARGLYEAGCALVSSYPGTPSTEITEYAAKYDEIYAEWAPNEKVALEAAFGAALSGRRSFCGMKHVGLNVAADPLFTLSYTGINAGLVIGVADDPGMHSSQNEQDSRHYARAAKLPMLEPSDSAEALAFTRAAYSLSEQYDTPVLLRMCTRVSHSRCVVEPGERAEPERRAYDKKPRKYIMMPGNARTRHPLVEVRLQELAEYAETAPCNIWERGSDRSLGIITSGTAYQYVKEAFGDTYGVLKLGMVYPLPERLLLDFAVSVDSVIIIEELDGLIEDHCRAVGIPVTGKELFSPIGELSQGIVAEKLGGTRHKGMRLNETLPSRPPVMCAGCPHRGLFYTLAKQKVTVLGDIGCYTLGAVPPLSAMDTTVCMGASVSSLHGFLKGNTGAEGKTAAVIGDSTFIHSGITGLVNVAYNDSRGVIIILDNSTTGMTGHQQNPVTGYHLRGDPAAKVDLEALCRAVGIRRVRVIDPYDLMQCDEAIREELAAGEASVIISRRPCTLLKHIKPKPPLSVVADKCIGCGMCMKIGCPAISFREGIAVVDATLCTGCGICAQLCRFAALQRREDA